MWTTCISHADFHSTERNSRNTESTSLRLILSMEFLLFCLISNLSLIFRCNCCFTRCFHAISLCPFWNYCPTIWTGEERLCFSISFAFVCLFRIEFFSFGFLIIVPRNACVSSREPFVLGFNCHFTCCRVSLGITPTI